MTSETAGLQACEDLHAPVAERSHLKHLFHLSWRAGEILDGVHKAYVAGAEAAVTS